MRAKEFIEQNQSSIKYIDDIKGIINELMPLRQSKEATDNYFNQILSADIRRQNYLLQKDLYEKNNAMQQQEPNLETFPNEIPIERATDIRNLLFQVVREDKSFGFLFFLLGTEQNAKHKAEPIDCIPNSQQINEAIKHYRDNYPKQTLDDYLDDNFNYLHYDFLVNNGIFTDEETVILNYFNELYLLYDELRCKKHKIMQARQYCRQLADSATADIFWQFSFIAQLIDTTEQEDIQLQRCKIEIQKIIAQLQPQLYPQGVPNSKQNGTEIKPTVFLSTARGKKVNLIRVINCLYEMDFFKDKSQNEISKKDVFQAFGQLLSIDLSSYQNDLSVSKSTANRDMKSSLKIFEDLLDKQKEINTQKE